MGGAAPAGDSRKARTARLAGAAPGFGPRLATAAGFGAAGFDSTCGELFQLIGTRLAVFNAELRFPIANQLVFKSLPAVFPPIEGAVFFDAGVTWQDGTSLKLTRRASDDLHAVRAPLASWGVSIRGNFFGFMILRGDYAKPISRENDGAYWTISFGPMF